MSYVITGRVLDTNGRGLPGLTVRAYMQTGFRSLTELGSASVQSDGTYGIIEENDELAGIVVVVFDGSTEVARSRILFSIPPSEPVEGLYTLVIDIAVGEGPYLGLTEYERMKNAIDAETGAIADPTDLGPDDVEWLAGKLDLYPPYVAIYLQALKFAFAHSIDAKAFYGLGRRGIKLDADKVLSRDANGLRRTLREAYDLRIIPADTASPILSIDDEIDEFVDALEDLAIGAALDEGGGATGTNMRTLLETASFSVPKQTTFLKQWKNRSGSVAQFWTDLEAHPDFDSDDVALLQFTVHGATLTRNFAPALAGLQAKRTGAEITTIKDLAAWDVDDWVDFLEDPLLGPINAPDDLPGETTGDRVQLYAKALERNIAVTYPTAVLARRIEAATPPGTTGVVDFLDDNPSFDITSTVYTKFIAENPSQDPGPTAAANVKAVQRLHKVAPQYAKHQVVVPLLEAGYTSAHSIMLKGKADFVAQMSAAFAGTLDDTPGETIAKVVFENASVHYAAATQLMAHYGAAMHGIAPISVNFHQSNLGEGDGLPTLEALFGSLDYCDCPHCRSVYGPAAYLVDLFNFLRGSNALAGSPELDTALDVLFERRPDLRFLELSCENTNTVLPYIDLVNEILEDQIAPPSPSVASYQTTLTTAELLVMPEHDENTEAYDALAAAVFPWNLPFARWHEEVRIYLKHLGVQRHVLMRVLQIRGGSPSTYDASEEDIAAEILGLTPLQRDHLTGAEIPDGTPASFWGLTGGSGWSTPLVAVEETMRRAGLTFEELDELLHMRFVDPDEGEAGELAITFDPPGCVLANAEISNLSDDAAARLNRFLRLHRKVDLRPRELDRAIHDLGAGDISESFIVSLGEMVLLRPRLALSPFEMLSLWAVLDTRIYHDDEVCLYDRLFQNRLVTYPVDAEFRLNTARTQLAVTGTIDDAHSGVVRAALRLTETDLQLLMAPDNPTECTDVRNLANLSALHRHAALARALDLSISELVVLRTWTPVNLFNTPAEMRDFLDVVATVRGSGFTFEEIDYLIRHEISPYGTVAPFDSDVERLLGELATALSKAAADVLVADDPDGLLVAQHVAIVLPSLVADMLTLLNKTTGFISDDTHFIEDNFVEFMVDTTDAVNRLTTEANPEFIDEPIARYRYVSELILRYLARVDVLDQRLASAFGIDRTAAHALVFTILALPDGTGRLRDLFLAEDFDGTDAEDTAGWLLLVKASLLARKFKIPADHLNWFFESSVDHAQWLNINTLPLESLTDLGPIQSLFAQWLAIAEEMDLRKSFKTKTNVHADIATAGGIPDLDTATTLLSDATGWSKDDLDYLVGTTEATGFMADGSELADQVLLRRLRDAMKLIRRLGVAAAEAWAWAHEEPDQDQAREVRNGAKSKYGEDRWPEVARPIHDDLRQQRRDALAAHLVAIDDRFESVDELYGYFLIDTKMCACMLTSRLKQAISSTQQFIQRTLLNLEDRARLSPEKTEEWDWMKLYRVWEANRKVFLYPENWIEPELRDDKTPFFIELERDLRKGELDDVTVENAYKSYLLKLHSVADLEVAGFFHERTEAADDEPVDIVHVIGRTKAKPHTHYYRKRIDSAYWTPWEEIPLEIDGDHLCPVVHNRRLFLFWATFVEASLPPDQGDDPPPPPNFLRPVIMWSELWNGAWSRQRTARVPRWLRSHHYQQRAADPSAILMKVHKGGYHQQFIGEGALWLELSQLEWRNVFLETREPHYIDPDTDDTHMWAQFRYDDCIDDLVLMYANDKDPPNNPYDGNHLGVPLFAGVLANAYVSRMATNVEDENFVDEPLTSSFQAVGQLPSGALASAPAFHAVPDRFRVVLPQDHEFLAFGTIAAPGARLPHLFYGDRKHTFFVTRGYQSVDYIPPAGIQLAELLVPIDIDLTVAPSPENPPEIPAMLDGLSFTKLWGDSVPGAGATQLVLGKAAAGVAAAGNVAIAAMTAANTSISGDFTLENTGPAPGESYSARYRFYTFNHPYTCLFLKELNRHGIPGLLAPGSSSPLNRQQAEEDYFVDRYVPDEQNVDIENRPIDDITFDLDAGFGVYNWELFFHAPLTIAKRLSTDQRFEEAMTWYHYIFNPLVSPDESDPPDVTSARFWRTKPLYELAQGKHVDDLRLMLGYEGTPAEQQEARDRFYAQVDTWRRNPFKPHAVARMRNSAYARYAVMAYLDNLIAWGDSLFRRDTIETINEATQLYVIAEAILGPRPAVLPEQEVTARTWDDIEGSLDAFSNAIVELENYSLVKALGASVGDQGFVIANHDLPKAPPPVFGWYFCFPPNDKLLAYWDTVADRLFKIRNCMNIEGVVRQLPLFEPPIDPALLVKAAAAGVDIGQAVQGLGAPLPRYRYATFHQRAMDICNEVKSLGGALLSALEKQDAEAIALLRSSHELRLLDAVTELRKLQIREANESVTASQRSAEAIERRLEHYTTLVDEGLSPGELANLIMLAEGLLLSTSGQTVSLVGKVMQLIPEIRAGWTGIGPEATVQFGGRNLGTALSVVGEAISLGGTLVREAGSIVGVVAGHQRRAQDWKYQRDQAEADLKAARQQIVAAQVRVAVAERELENHELQIRNAKEADDFMRSKYTNIELYDWMIGQLSELHFQAYQLAFDTAKRAERCYQFELADSDASFITAGYWDSLKKGLFAGERLQFDLRRMEAAYLENNKREYELTKNVSLLQCDPVALLRLQQTGTCEFEIPEALFDLDHPGQYMRRIRSVALSMPAVAGPHTTVGVKLTLLRDTLRTSSAMNPASPETYRRDPEEDERFVDSTGGIKAIATSSGQNDAGLFEVSFRDERFLPFEGAGAESRWRVELPDAVPQFDYTTISDVVLHISYTARDGGSTLRSGANANLREIVNDVETVAGDLGLTRGFSVRAEFPAEWNAFLFAPDTTDPLLLELDLSPERFPFAYRQPSLGGAEEGLQIDSVELALVLRRGFEFGTDDELRATVTRPGNDTNDVTLTVLETEPRFGGAATDRAVFSPAASTPGTWTISVARDDLGDAPSVIVDGGGSNPRLAGDAIQDLVLLVHYTMVPPA